ncbi:MAG: host-nuclease inhibitor Gam family protein [Bacteroidetes bacterium]|nr:host-nuclease inhibitor Gam family protein [Bacteroidota bacterium]
MSEPNFMDELLAEVESEEALRSAAETDLSLLEIQLLTEKIAATFASAEEEQTIIQNFALRRAAKFQDRIDRLAGKLETYIREKNEKTITLPHGVLKVRKKPDRIEIADMQEFLLHASPQMLNTIPEKASPCAAGIKSWMKLSGKLPAGVKLIPGGNEFSYKLTEINDNGTNSETEA